MEIRALDVISLLSALTVFLLGWLQWRSQSKVHKADALDKIGEAYDALLDRLNLRISELESRVAYLEKELKHYTNWSARLVQQLVSHGIEPVSPDTQPIKSIDR